MDKYSLPSPTRIEGHAQLGQSHRYRWGTFLGWLMVGFAALFLVIAASAFFLPHNSIARNLVNGFFKSQGRLDLWQKLRSGGAPDLGYVDGWFTEKFLLTLGCGVGLLKKRTFGLVCVVFVIIQTVLAISIVPFIFWAGSIPYYYKRRHEFRIP